MLRLFLIIALLSMTACAGDWLEGGYVGSANYGEIRQYFTDPIFYTRVPVSQPLSFYRPYITTYPYPFYATQSEFRNQSLAAMQWDPFVKNWTSTMSYAASKSSFRVFEGGSWKSL
ncbi:MAG TPA: hypothetical protein PLN19_00010 [Methanothrix sp.]|jgi:hypothetical protein|nr:hypothetical protein [Methanothrix sp.]HOV82566.1 hypothetical protein [Methanothrix sp.]HPC88856.1 hypothetical protein [Methanothrix sp.]HQE86633.1 hypothetical protein [Methanothrix sp.]HQI67162.1 hypothetical protein [Methanothrix sp.]